MTGTQGTFYKGLDYCPECGGYLVDQSYYHNGFYVVQVVCPKCRGRWVDKSGHYTWESGKKVKRGLFGKRHEDKKKRTP